MKEITPQKLADLIRRHSRLVALTGAGISVESGIPDFRSPGGLWTRYDPMEYASIRAFRKHPAKVWQLLLEMDATITPARPNPAHCALAALEAQGKLLGVITQNVDNLHQAAGSKKVVEYHGNALRFVCDHCRGHHPRETLDFSHPPLYCLCGGLIRPDVVFFGEPIPSSVQKEAKELAQNCDLLLIIGTSGEVSPANYLPLMAKDHGAVIVENNLEPTILTRSVTDYLLQGQAGELWPLVLQHLQKITPEQNLALP
ncbi:MAG: SIR2 family NAD-dependent protein deacylase [Thermodesulfobacteriota bacterium]